MFAMMSHLPTHHQVGLLMAFFFFCFLFLMLMFVFGTSDTGRAEQSAKFNKSGQSNARKTP